MKQILVCSKATAARNIASFLVKRVDSLPRGGGSPLMRSSSFFRVECRTLRAQHAADRHHGACSPYSSDGGGRLLRLFRPDRLAVLRSNCDGQAISGNCARHHVGVHAVRHLRANNLHAISRLEAPVMRQQEGSGSKTDSHDSRARGDYQSPRVDSIANILLCDCVPRVPNLL